MNKNQSAVSTVQLIDEAIRPPDQWLLIKTFLESIRDDPRITVFHISIYLSLVYEWERKDYEQPLSVVSRVILSYAKISSPATWHKCIRALHAWGYIEYMPSYSNVLGSLVKFRPPLGSPQGENMAPSGQNSAA